MKGKQEFEFAQFISASEFPENAFSLEYFLSGNRAEIATSTYPRSNLPGSITMPLSKLKTPSTVIPTNLNGKANSQNIG